MEILDDLISILDFNAPVKDIRQGVFHTGVLTRYCGLAATLPRDALKHEGLLVKEPGSLLDKHQMISSKWLTRKAFLKPPLEWLSSTHSFSPRSISEPMSCITCHK
ncbi:MAG TPA: DUF4213 domain-containing protein [Desulfobacterales bacterium]|nr:DUF4213 domain-containing protein [Desulfobacterales bacterium]